MQVSVATQLFQKPMAGLKGGVSSYATSRERKDDRSSSTAFLILAAFALKVIPYVYTWLGPTTQMSPSNHDCFGSDW